MDTVKHIWVFKNRKQWQKSWDSLLLLGLIYISTHQRFTFRFPPCFAQDTMDLLHRLVLQSQQSPCRPKPFLGSWHVLLFACLVSLWHSETQSVVLFLSGSSVPWRSRIFFLRHPFPLEPLGLFCFDIYHRWVCCCFVYQQKSVCVIQKKKQ